MNVREYLMLQLIEELGEVQKELSKCLRFTPDHVYNGQSNIERARGESIEVMAIADMLRAEGIETGICVPDKMSLDDALKFSKRQEQARHFMQISADMGTLSV
jgi:hypothetical protein